MILRTSEPKSPYDIFPAPPDSVLSDMLLSIHVTTGCVYSAVDVIDTANAFPMSQLVGKFTHDAACDISGVNISINIMTVNFNLCIKFFSL